MKKSVNKVTFWGHAAFSLETSGKVLFIDPFLSGNPSSPILPDEVHTDFIAVTHGHGDHLGDTISIAKRTGATVISNAEICDWLEEKHHLTVHAQHLGGGFHHPFGYLKLTLALHGSQLPDGSNGGNPAGILVTTLDGHKFYHAGDTGLFGDMQLIGDEGVDLAAIPIGDNYTMGPVDALRAVKLLRPKVVIPMHFDTFPLLHQNVLDWKQRVESETDTKVQILKPGESTFF